MEDNLIVRYLKIISADILITMNLFSDVSSPIASRVCGLDLGDAYVLNIKVPFR